MPRKTPVELASDEIKEELTEEIRELESKKKVVERDLEDLEVKRLKRSYDTKIRFSDYFKSTMVYQALRYIRTHIDKVFFALLLSSLIVALVVCLAGAVNSLANLHKQHVAAEKEEERIAEEKKQAEEAKSVFHDQGGNLWTTDGLVSEERYKKQLPLFTTQHNIASIDVEKGVIEEDVDTWCGCDEKKQIPAIEAWIVVQNTPTQTVEMK